MGLKLKTKKVSQNTIDMYLGTFTFKELSRFTKYTERIIVNYLDKGIDNDFEFFDNSKNFQPIYNHQIQRKTNAAKVERIADYLIFDKNSMFPTNIVLSLPTQIIISSEIDTENNVTFELDPIVEEEIQKRDGNSYITIIDGQHRIKGIERAVEKVKYQIHNSENYEEQNKHQRNLDLLYNFEFLVTFFVDVPLEYQAMIFSTINKTQTKVPENLVYSLFGLNSDDSPQKSALECVLALNGIEKSPFYNRVKLLGSNYRRGLLVPLSQATMVKSVLFNICKNQREAEIERNIINRIEFKNNPNSLVFREYYANNNDKMIVRIMYSFFSAVRDTFKLENGNSLWDFESTPNTNVLQTNVGYQALMKLLVDILKITPEDQKDKKSYYIEFLEKAKGLDFIDSGEVKRYPFTSASVKILYTDLKEKIGL